MLCLSYMYIVQYLILKYVGTTLVQQCMYTCYMFVLQVDRTQSKNRLRNCFVVVVECLFSHPMFLEFASYDSMQKFVKPCSACVVLPCFFLYCFMSWTFMDHPQIPGLKVTQKKSEWPQRFILLRNWKEIQHWNAVSTLWPGSTCLQRWFATTN